MSERNRKGRLEILREKRNIKDRERERNQERDRARKRESEIRNIETGIDKIFINHIVSFLMK